MDNPNQKAIRKPNMLEAIDGETLADMRLPPTQFSVEGLLPQGVTLLGGAAKIGKSWMVLDLCVSVAAGIPFFHLQTTRGTVLYLCLEDTLSRVQDRLNSMTDSPPANLFFAVSAGTIADGLCEQIRNFKESHPSLSLVAIDTFQVVRGSDPDMSYAEDYADVRKLKELADALNISLLLIHHLRKQGDSDPVNRLSGTTGLSGAVDAIFILQKESRESAEARLICTGRDIEQRELRLCFSKDLCRWSCTADSLEQPETALPTEMEQFVRFMRNQISFSGSNTQLAEVFNRFWGTSIQPKTLKQKMNRWRYVLEDCGVFFESKRSNGVRSVTVNYIPPVENEPLTSPERDASDVPDA